MSNLSGVYSVLPCRYSGKTSRNFVLKNWKSLKFPIETKDIYPLLKSLVVTKEHHHRFVKDFSWRDILFQKKNKLVFWTPQNSILSATGPISLSFRLCLDVTIDNEILYSSADTSFVTLSGTSQKLTTVFSRDTEKLERLSLFFFLLFIVVGLVRNSSIVTEL